MGRRGRIINSYFTVINGRYEIRCKLYYNDPEKIQRAVLFGHGFGGHKDNGAANRFADCALSRDDHMAVITFNWPCHGDDTSRELKLEDCNAYVRTLVSYIKDRYGISEVLAYATSYGGYLFLRSLAEDKDLFAKVALRCPAVDMYKVLTESIMTEDNRKQILAGENAMVGFDRKIKVSPEFVKELRSADITETDYSGISEKTIILHGTQDEIVSFDAVKRFAEKNKIPFVPVDGADHRFSDKNKMDEAICKMCEYLDI